MPCKNLCGASWGSLMSQTVPVVCGNGIACGKLFEICPVHEGTRQISEIRLAQPERNADCSTGNVRSPFCRPSPLKCLVCLRRGWRLDGTDWRKSAVSLRSGQRSLFIYLLFLHPRGPFGYCIRGREGKNSAWLQLTGSRKHTYTNTYQNDIVCKHDCLKGYQ